MRKSQAQHVVFSRGTIPGLISSADICKVVPGRTTQGDKGPGGGTVLRQSQGWSLGITTGCSSARMGTGVVPSSPPTPSLMPFLAQPLLLRKPGPQLHLFSAPAQPGSPTQCRCQMSLLLAGSGTTSLGTRVIFIKSLTCGERPSGPPCLHFGTRHSWNPVIWPSFHRKVIAGVTVAHGAFLSSWESMGVLHEGKKCNPAPGHVLWSSQERWRLGAQ